MDKYNQILQDLNDATEEDRDLDLDIGKLIGLYPESATLSTSFGSSDVICPRRNKNLILFTGKFKASDGYLPEGWRFYRYTNDFGNYWDVCAIREEVYPATLLGWGHAKLLLAKASCLIRVHQYVDAQRISRHSLETKADNRGLAAR